MILPTYKFDVKIEHSVAQLATIAPWGHYQVLCP